MLFLPFFHQNRTKKTCRPTAQQRRPRPPARRLLLLLLLLFLRRQENKAMMKESGHPLRGAPSRHQQLRRWPSPMPLLVALVVLAEIAFLGRIDVAEKATSVVEQWSTSLYSSSYSSSSSSSSSVVEEDKVPEDIKRCEEWLEREDAVAYSRDFRKDPIFVSGMHKEWSSCDVDCDFGFANGKVPDAAFGLPQDPAIAGVLRSMESSRYYPENNVGMARRWIDIHESNFLAACMRGYKVVMTTSLSSDVPVGYFSWAEYDIMSPMQQKTEEALAAAFISNCGAHNFRLQALDMLEELGIKIDSYGSCHRNRDGNVNKVETLKRYKFSLAFENSNEVDYVTEKYFQSLVAGTIPVVVGAPNIQDFAPSPGSVLHIKELHDVASVAKTMRDLATNPDAYNHTLRWKYEGPSDSFKALMDMAAVHSSCRLCIHLATKIHDEEEKSAAFHNRPCHCTSSLGTVYHLFVRERGRFKMESIYLRSGKLTLEALKSAVLAKFRSLNHTSIWKNERPAMIRGRNDLKIYRIYPVGITQQKALYTFQFNDDAELEKYIESNSCAKLEVIFV
ncbi:glycoprotein 3-alpha-L-fucosyltransferase [Musa troglodytarum]|uniref:Fucosyltransferase n=1 Tax=Musa troglodytarum TaxID=320322 RepID=A0A9E7F706_9LILI|nr:glycoprotein 3-alpha-L-fucosyltransferase [Musa troglodytarum]